MTLPEFPLFIDGKFCSGSAGRTIPVENPATGEGIGQLAMAETDDIQRAAIAAAQAFPKWKRQLPIERSRILREAAQLIRTRVDRIAATMTAEQGKLIAEATRETLFAADVFDWYAEEGRRIYGETIPSRFPGVRQSVLREPVGPVAAFTPWNFPAGAVALKVAAALAAGCSCVLKAAEETPGTALAIARALADAGLPGGVLNLVFGVPSEISTALIGHPAIRKISFTGSPNVGRELGVLAAQNLKRVTLELGGHAPVLVCDDADPIATADTIAAAKYRNAGQVCISPTRVFVPEGQYKRFVDRFAEKAAEIKPGPGNDTGSTMGPLANARRVAAMERIVADASAKGGRIVTGGRRIGNAGHFFEPTVIADATDDMMVMNEEPFGPVAAITSYTELSDAIARANRLPYGLAGYAFTGSSSRAAELKDALEVGLLGINHLMLSTPETPFGGVKDSGYGLEGGREGLQPYLVTKFVAEA